MIKMDSRSVSHSRYSVSTKGKSVDVGWSIAASLIIKLTLYSPREVSIHVYSLACGIVSHEFWHVSVHGRSEKYIILLRPTQEGEHLEFRIRLVSDTDNHYFTL